MGLTSVAKAESDYRISTFKADVTIPLNHRCMGVLPTKSKKVLDPLEAIGFVLTGPEKPIVYVAVDWCEIRNGAYDQWREKLAKAAGTTRERVLVSSLHQHDAPVTDTDAAKLLRDVGLEDELFDEQFHEIAIANVVAAIQLSAKHSQPVTHFGTGQAEVHQVASNRRIVMPDGRVSFSRGSSSGANEFMSQAPDGEIDPLLKTLSFWNEDQPLLALHCYATHPMSYYGRGEVSSDFVGLARRKMQLGFPEVVQIYASGCSGDVTAGKYNNGSPESRVELTNRIYEAMQESWQATEKTPLTAVDFRSTELDLNYYDHAQLKRKHLEETLNNKSKRTEDRILAAMSLASLDRVESGQRIDFPCIDFGNAQIVLFPGESFVGYQLMAQQMKPDSFVVSIGYGECWPGYVPTNKSFADHFHDKWLWVGPGAENNIRQALKRVLIKEEN
nr:hypothetical protein [Planctomicrobium sp.]